MVTDFASIEPLNKAADQAENKALTSNAASYTLPQKLQEAISSRFNNSAIVQQRDAALPSVLTSADRSREAVAGMVNSGTILSPTQQQSIMSARRAADVVPLISLNDLLQNQFGSIGDLVNAGTAGFQGQVAADEGAARLARERANSALSSLIAQRELELKEQQASGSGNMLEQLLPFLMPQGQQQSGSISPTSGIGPQFSSPLGTIVEDDETGNKFEQTAQGWVQMAPAAAPEPNIFERLFGGIKNLVFGG